MGAGDELPQADGVVRHAAILRVHAPVLVQDQDIGARRDDLVHLAVGRVALVVVEVLEHPQRRQAAACGGRCDQPAELVAPLPGAPVRAAAPDVEAPAQARLPVCPEDLGAARLRAPRERAVRFDKALDVRCGPVGRGHVEADLRQELSVEAPLAAARQEPLGGGALDVGALLVAAGSGEEAPREFRIAAQVERDLQREGGDLGRLRALDQEEGVDEGRAVGPALEAQRELEGVEQASVRSAPAELAHLEPPGPSAAGEPHIRLRHPAGGGPGAVAQLAAQPGRIGADERAAVERHTPREGPAVLRPGEMDALSGKFKWFRFHVPLTPRGCAWRWWTFSMLFGPACRTPARSGRHASKQGEYGSRAGWRQHDPFWLWRSKSASMNDKIAPESIRARRRNDSWLG